jgi:hypothetical protein
VVDKNQIIELLNKYFDYDGDVTIDDEGLVSCTGDVELKQSHQHTTLPVAFGSVGGNFECRYTQLTTLAGAPQSVGGFFDCRYNKLTTLHGAPTSVGGTFSCSNNKLATLAGAPHTVGGYFNCSLNQLISLTGAPTSVSGGFICYNNQLTTLAGAPQIVGGGFYCDNNPLATLEGLPIQLNYLRLSFSPNLPLLRALYAPEIEFDPELEDPTLLKILNRYAGQGKRGVIRCQKELISAGFEANAQW